MNLEEKVLHSIELLRKYEPQTEYYGRFSGGKDSCVIKHLSEKAGVRVSWYYSVIIDPPELQQFIREHHPDVIWDYPDVPFFEYVAKVGMPGPWMRFCCSKFKERAGKGCFKIVGVRSAESPRRARSWNEVSATILAPILNWSDEDIWDYIILNKIPYCKLYDEGFDRLGCVGCPLASQKSRERDFLRWPKFEKAWMNACKKLWETKALNDCWVEKQQITAEFSCWQDHWYAWRSGMGEYMERLKKERSGEIHICADNDLERYQQ